jgi:hypothetical protein
MRSHQIRWAVSPRLVGSAFAVAGCYVLVAEQGSATKNRRAARAAWREAQAVKRAATATNG